MQLLHPRVPLYVVPWGDGLFMIGATLIETEDAGPVSVRSALELLGGAYAVHPAFAEAEIIDLGVGVRPAFPDNVPRAVVREDGRHIFVNGAYRHGFLLAPVLARAVADYHRERHEPRSCSLGDDGRLRSHHRLDLRSDRAARHTFSMRKTSLPPPKMAILPSMSLVPRPTIPRPRILWSRMSSVKRVRRTCITE